MDLDETTTNQSPDDQQIKRQRGRPRKNNNITVNLNEEKRGRGRPRKNKPLEEQEEPESEGILEQESEGKHDLTKNENQQIKRKRGRPRKKPLEDEEKQTYMSKSFQELAKSDEFVQEETLLIADDNMEAIPKSIIRFESRCEQKQYTEQTEGVLVAMVSQKEGILRINKEAKTILNEHDTDIRYIVQRGYCKIQLNADKILLKVADTIKIPKFNKYEITNPSKNQEAFMIFEFDKRE